MSTLRWQTHQSPIGALLVAESDQGLALLTWCETWDAAESILCKRLGDQASYFEHDPKSAQTTTIEQFFQHAGRVEPPPLDVTGTVFQTRVWAALRTLPVGETRSYAEVAAMIGQPGAARAVAGACAANPVTLFTPCHRVVRAGGEIGGYGGGLDRKRALLALEQGSPFESTP
ncbi:methylated-DNA--[protein]-cysteine S-methyltransferase [Salinisphaera orenii]|uniref:methylated-DNA--[protein]-cysteine S-methyltransferase n=1 Tax=Salinisphaera orenii TaxID=856731 RepID=UPI001E406E03